MTFCDDYNDEIVYLLFIVCDKIYLHINSFKKRTFVKLINKDDNIYKQRSILIKYFTDAF